MSGKIKASVTVDNKINSLTSAKNPVSGALISTQVKSTRELGPEPLCIGEGPEAKKMSPLIVSTADSAVSLKFAKMTNPWYPYSANRAEVRTTSSH